jgi:2-oxoisovalerate dehydrogenase E2 component (dihydrolipoyl transacylase)
MAYEVTMPQLGETVVEGTISKWLKQIGDRVERFDPLVEVITDKVTVEVPSPVSGTITEILVHEGDTVRVGTVLALIEAVEGEAVPVEARPKEEAAPAPTAAPARAAPRAEAAGPQRASPAVRRLAQEHGVDLSQVRGTGMGGRITKEDVEAFIAQREKTPAPTAPTAPPAPVAGEEIPLTPIRRIIAEHMVRSKTTIPHALTSVEVDMTNIVRFRDSIREQFRQREGVDLSYVAFIIKAVVEALKESPLLNSAWGDNKIVLKKEINIGVAVAVPDGLIVPVVRRADGLSIAGLARAISELADRARAGKLALADVEGGTFTVNNTGAFGSVFGVPIINHPQAAILNMEAIVKRPVVVDEAIAIRSMMFLCLAFDHRILDGALAGRFLQRVKGWLESFGPNVPIY